jgi:hypothetical protein
MVRFLVSVILGGAVLFGSGYAVWDIAPPKVPPEFRPWEIIAKHPDVAKAILQGDIKSGVYSDSTAFLTPEEKKAKEDKEKADRDAAQPMPENKLPEVPPEEKKADERKAEPPAPEQKPMRLQIIVNKEPRPLNERMLFGGAQCLAAAFLLALVIKAAKLWSFVGRWFIAILIGALIAIWSQGNEYIWFDYAREYSQYMAAYTAVSFALAGFFIAMGTGPSEADY